jgi:hypothetical protein
MLKAPPEPQVPIMTSRFRFGTIAFVLTLVFATPAAYAQDGHTAELPMLGKWTGVFRQILMTQDSRNAGGETGYISGTSLLQPVYESGVLLYDVTLIISSNNRGDTLEWGISMGRCGSKLIMLQQANQLPSFDTRSGGDGEMHHTLPLDLDSKHTYQVVLFRNGHAQQNVVACSNLKYDDRLR